MNHHIVTTNMEQTREELIEAHFERDYDRVRPILERILPQLSKDGWLPTKTKRNSMYHGITALEIERATCNHYFRTHTQEYERENPDLPQIHPYWYALLRDFVQIWARKSPLGRIIQRMHKDFGKHLEDEDAGVLEDYINKHRRQEGFPEIDTSGKVLPL
jgi:hypothetical protein